MCGLKKRMVLISMRSSRQLLVLMEMLAARTLMVIWSCSHNVQISRLKMMTNGSTMTIPLSSAQGITTGPLPTATAMVTFSIRSFWTVFPKTWMHPRAVMPKLKARMAPISKIHAFLGATVSLEINPSKFVNNLPSKFEGFFESRKDLNVWIRLNPDRELRE